MRHIAIIIILITTSLHCTAQNDTTKDGLKVGRWVEEYETQYGNCREVGDYKIISFSAYHILNNGYKKLTTLENDNYPIKYNGFEQLLFISGRHYNFISVKDSTWNTFDTTGRIIKTEIWRKGLSISTKSYNEKGSLYKYDTTDYKNNNDYYFTYINDRLFKKETYPPNNKNESYINYYPENDLVILNAELDIAKIIRGTTKRVTSLTITSKNPVQILSFNHNQSAIYIDTVKTKLPCLVKPKDTLRFSLIYNPDSKSYYPFDTITIRTSEKGVSGYKVYCYLWASHINSSNIETLKHLTLSKAKDRYLLIAPMGTETDISITDAKDKTTSYIIYKITKIDLNTFVSGEYIISVRSCNIGGYLKLTITE